MRQEPEAAVQALVRQLSLIEELECHRDGRHFDLALPASDLAGDDAFMDYLQTSHLVGNCLSVSLDALRTVRLVLLDPHVQGGLRLPMVAQYAILRTATEAAALATWLLQSHDRGERVGRSLQVRMDDVLRDDQLATVITDSLPGDSKAVVAEHQRHRRENARQIRERKAHLRALAAVAGIDVTVFQRGLPGFGPIIAQASSEIGSRSTVARATWQMISGLTHPSASRTMTLSAVDFQDDTSNRALFTADPAVIVHATDAALRFHLAALRLASVRGGNAAVAFERSAASST
ncbi:hypothetical protein HOW07_09975 [Plantibacter sp. MCCC 1A11337]|uniref:hypothetical protein n=1 Tax=Plantibacter sp. MCCC 1A11337 TaxID=2736644 RepID=UPI0015832FD8|nr:hypothetical protein [Plantibacter sp. MCCC 1A11337]NUJ88336.1 hypothetical protein [Plantibacter sp. MCCC 1A11337]